LQILPVGTKEPGSFIPLDAQKCNVPVAFSLSQSQYTDRMMNAVETYDKINILKSAFKGLNDNELQEMAALSHFNTYPEGHILCHEGADEDVFYIIADGTVLITQKLSADEGTRTLRKGGKGDVVGEMALIQNTSRAATVHTISPCTMLEMEKADFETILSRSPRLALDIIRITLDRLRENDRTAIEDLTKTNKVLRHLDRNKLEFIQVAAHELRTPLTVLKGYLGLLHDNSEIAANPSLRAALAGIDRGADRMHEIVNMMLDVSRVDTDTLETTFALVPLKRFIDTLADNLQKAALERDISIITRHAKDTPNIQANPAMLQKALHHLIINAIKYTPDGGQVIISTQPTQMADNRPGVEIAVKDTGIGLDPEHHELVFEKFYQVGDVALHSSGKTTFKGGGPGLGLSLVRGVAHAHNGKTWAESPGHDEVNLPGSTFFLQLPVDPLASQNPNVN